MPKIQQCFLSTRFIILGILLFLIVACEGTSPPATLPPPPREDGIFQVRVQSANSGNPPIRDAVVTIAMPGIALQTDYTDNRGSARFMVDESYNRLPAELRITASGYEPYENDINIYLDELPLPIRLKPIAQPPTPMPTSTATATVPAEPIITPDSMAPSPTATIPPSPTPTATIIPEAIPPTPAPTLETPPDTFMIEASIENAELYLEPDVTSGVRAFLQPGLFVEAIGRTTENEFYLVEFDDDLELWIEALDVILPDDVQPDYLPITTDAILTSDEVETEESGSTPSNCFSISVANGPSEDPFGIRLFWQGLPDGTDHFSLTVTGNTNGETKSLIEPNTIDTNDVDTANRGFLLGSWRFGPDGPQGFPENTTFTYTMRARDTGNSIICTVSGTFVK